MKRIDEVLKALRKKWGDSAIMSLSGPVKRHPAIPTGSLMLDAATGIGGYPVGRIVEVYGPESSGKTTLALHAIANVQKAGGIAAFIDAEHALDLQYAQNVGVNTDKLLLSQPDYGEMGLQITVDLADSGECQLVVVDSVAALVPKAELEGDMGDHHIGVQARMMSQSMRKLAGVTTKHGCTVIFINQLRMKIGVMFGSPEVTTGGNALKFYASMRLDVRRRKLIDDGDEPTGNHGLVKVVKNKFAPPFREAAIELVWGKGIDAMADLVSAGIYCGIVTKSGAWLSFGDERLGQGFNNAAKTLLGDPGLRAQLESEVREAIVPEGDDGSGTKH